MKDLEDNHAKAKPTQAFNISPIPAFNGGEVAHGPSEVRVSNEGKVSKVIQGPEGTQKGLIAPMGAKKGLEVIGAKRGLEVVGAKKGLKVVGAKGPGSRVSNLPKPEKAGSDIPKTTSRTSSRTSSTRSSRSPSPEDMDFILGNNKDKGTEQSCQ